MTETFCGTLAGFFRLDVGDSYGVLRLIFCYSGCLCYFGLLLSISYIYMLIYCIYFLFLALQRLQPLHDAYFIIGSIRLRGRIIKWKCGLNICFIKLIKNSNISDRICSKNDEVNVHLLFIFPYCW